MTLPDAMELARLNGELGLALTEALVEIDRLRLAATPAPLDVLVAALVDPEPPHTCPSCGHDGLPPLVCERCGHRWYATPAPLDAISRAPFPHVGQHNSKVCVICAAIHDLATPAPLSPIVITVCPHSVDTRFTHCLLCERATPAAYAEETP